MARRHPQYSPRRLPDNQPAVGAVSRLPELAQAIERAHQAAIGAARSAIEHAVACGALLRRAKAEIGHGEWLEWIEANCTVGRRTAQVYMRLARELPKLPEANAQRVAHLTVREAAVLVSQHTAAIAALPPPRQDQLIDRAETKGERLVTALQHVQRAAKLADQELSRPATPPLHAGPERRKRLLKHSAARRFMLAIGPNVAGLYLDELMRQLEDDAQHRAKQSEIDDLTQSADELERRAAALRQEAAQRRKDLQSWSKAALVARHGPIQPFIETAEYSVDDETFEELGRLPEQQAIAALIDLIPARRGYWGDVSQLQFASLQPAADWTNVGNEHGLPAEILASLNPVAASPVTSHPRSPAALLAIRPPAPIPTSPC